MATSLGIAVLLVNAVLISAFPSDFAVYKKRGGVNVCMLSESDGDKKGNRFKTITPDDINSLFGGARRRITPNGGREGSVEEEEDDDEEEDEDDEDEEIDYTEDGDEGQDELDDRMNFVVGVTGMETSKTEDGLSPAEKTAADLNGFDSRVRFDSKAQRELALLQSMTPVVMNSANDGEGEGEGLGPSADIINSIASSAAVSMPSSAGSVVEEDELELAYVNFRAQLDQSTLRSVVSDMSVQDTLSIAARRRNRISPSGAPATASTDMKKLGSKSKTGSMGAGSADAAGRVFRYDPGDVRRGDPMLYGAYRQWKQAELDLAAAKTDNTKDEGDNRFGGLFGGGGRGSSGAGAGTKRRDGASGSSRDNKRGSSQQQGKKKKGDKKNDFYNAIKKLGSGPVSDDVSTGTGVAEPPRNVRPITPNKAPTKKNRRKVITPDDIDKLFDRPASSPSPDEGENQDDEDDDDDDDEGEEEEERGVVEWDNFGIKRARDSVGSSSSSTAAGSEEVPEWLQKAEKERKAAARRRKGGMRKKKALTDDWRFWAALVAGAGFISAFISIYQQTGGFGGGSGAPGADGGVGGGELII